MVPARSGSRKTHGHRGQGHPVALFRQARLQHTSIPSIPIALDALAACDDLAAMNTTRQREHWDGDPIELGDAWTLRKGQKVARCILVTHPLGSELRLMTSDLLRSQVCRSSEEILSTHEAWKTAMLDRGWQDR